MSEHDQHEDLLMALLTGEGDPKTALRDSPLAGCESCAAQVREHLALAERLGALGKDEEQEIEAALAAAAPAPGPAEENLRRQIVSEARPSPDSRSWPWIAAAAAAGLAFLVWLRSGDSPKGPDPLLGSGLELLYPVGEVDSFAPFRWSDEGPGNGWYRVVVFPEEAPDTMEPIDSGPVREQSWSPDPLELERCGTRIRWQVEVYGGAGEGDILDSKHSWASLSSR